MRTDHLDVAEICRAVLAIQRGGGQFRAFQPSQREYLVLFNHPDFRTTLALPLSQLSEESVHERIASVDHTDGQTRSPQQTNRRSQSI